VQYTASSFAEIVTSHFGWALRPRTRAPRIEGFFPPPSGFRSAIGDSVLDRFLVPAARRLRDTATRARAYHQGDLQHYVLYIVAAILLLLLFNVRVEWVVTQLCGR
jgi:hypothetical protein